MAQTGDPTAPAVRLQTHATVIHKVSLGDRGVARIEQQLERQRRPGPFTGVNFGNTFLHELGFIVAVGQSAIPKC